MSETSRKTSGAEQDQNPAQPGALVSHARPVDDGAGSARDDGKVSMIDLVIARGIESWLSGPLHTAQIYAEGLLSGAVTEVTEADDWEHVPAAMGHAIHEEHEASGFRWTLDAEAWEIGIRSIHGLAHGVIEHDGTHEPYGTETPLCMPWHVDDADLKATGLTPGDVAAAFDGNVLAAAEAFLCACELLPVL